MARKQTLVQLNDDLVRRLDEQAQRLDRSRSSLIREAIERYLPDDWDEDLAREYREAYERFPETEEELRWAEHSSRETLKHLDEWDGGW